MFRMIFPFTLFLSAILLFSIQPMIAKSLLPIYGGTPAVWTVCMLFFQMILLISYGYVWLLSQVKNTVYWRLIHSVFVSLSLFALPLLFVPYTAEGIPEWAILSNLLIQIGIPLLVIGASAPLLQFAYSQTKGERASDPYFLYSASNLGSLLILLLYPWVMERYIGLKAQYQLWTWGYSLYLCLLGFILIYFKYLPLKKLEEQLVVESWYTPFVWIFLSFVPCSLMLGVTLYITTDVAATPLFWVLPLALYLLTFVIAFSAKPFISPQWVSNNALFFLIFPVIGFILGMNQIRAWQMIIVHLVCFFMLALLCHGELYAKRPNPRALTFFYFCLALGGVLAGIFNGIIAPNVFNQVYEYPIAILLSVLVFPLTGTLSRWWVLPLIVLMVLTSGYFLPQIMVLKGVSTFQMVCVLALIIIVLGRHNRVNLFLSIALLFIFIFSPYFQENHLLLLERNFYSVKKVSEKSGVHVSISQSTLHGLQPGDEKKPINGYRSYYGALEPVINLMQNNHDSMAVTIMGLGVGTMICQHRETDKVTVIEIDEQVIQIAEDARFFTYLRDCPAKATLIKNDGRLAIENLKDYSQDILVLDAFNSDAIPVHLMTLEAFRLYQKKLTENGIILVNISNRHLDVLPVLNAIGHSLDFMVFQLTHTGNPKLGQFNSEWALLTMNQDFAFQLMKGTSWKFVGDSQQMLWTDDYSNIIPLLRWK